mmetsp:Transcript_17400/g.32608  ORF Transcript_17400/g.32608 Transcript_17400/m.32608 type:complete len:105 (+) Transcript_17400:1072-1386(+)
MGFNEIALPCGIEGERRIYKNNSDLIHYTIISKIPCIAYTGALNDAWSPLAGFKALTYVTNCIPTSPSETLLGYWRKFPSKGSHPLGMCFTCFSLMVDCGDQIA